MRIGSPLKMIDEIKAFKTKGGHMIKLIKMLKANRHVRAFLRPFLPMQSDIVAPNNKIVTAYFFDWHDKLSPRNFLLNSRFDIPLDKTEGDKE